MIKAILFDVHGTLIAKGGEEALDNARKKAASFLKDNGYNITYEDYLRAWYQNIKKHRQDMEELNEVSFYGWYGGILENLGIKNFTDKFIDPLNQCFMEGFKDTTKELPHVKFVLSELKSYYLLGAVSNSLGRNTITDLTRTGIVHFFDGIYLDIVTFKPEIGK